MKEGFVFLRGAKKAVFRVKKEDMQRMEEGGLVSENADAVVIGIADDDALVGGDADSVRAIEVCFGGEDVVAVVAAVFGADAGDGGDDVGFVVDFPDGLVFGIDDEDVVLFIEGDAFGAVEGGVCGGGVVAGVSFFARAGDVGEDVGVEVEFENGVAFAEGDVEMVVVGEEGTRADHWFALRVGVGRGLFFLARAGDGGEMIGFEINFADTVVADVSDVEIVVMQGDGVWAVELDLRGGALVVVVTLLAGAGDDAGEAGFDVDEADDVVFHFDDVDVASGVEADFIGFVERGFVGGLIVLAEGGLARAGDEAELIGFGIEREDAMVLHTANVKVTFWGIFHTEGLPDVDFVCWA